jgi:hypothetical protein
VASSAGRIGDLNSHQQSSSENEKNSKLQLRILWAHQGDIGLCCWTSASSSLLLEFQVVLGMWRRTGLVLTPTALPAGKSRRPRDLTGLGLYVVQLGRRRGVFHCFDGSRNLLTLSHTPTLRRALSLQLGSRRFCHVTILCFFGIRGNEMERPSRHERYRHLTHRHARLSTRRVART